MSANRDAVRSPKRLPLYAVIMAGGQSTRFWPLSRRHAPKQLLSIKGRYTLLQDTARRLLPLTGWQRLLVVTNAQHAAEVRRQLPQVPAAHVLVEPVGRNTAACLALAAAWLHANVGDALMVVVPADHVIKDAAGLRRTLRAAADLAMRRDCLVTIGVPPTQPETGYGYLEVGAAIPAAPPGACWVRRFHEKPAAAAARRYVASGRHLWNAGMFVWKTSVFRAALARCLPEVHDVLDDVWRAPRGAARRLRAAYARVQSVSVDVGVMQPISALRAGARGAEVPRVAVVRADFDWIDVGSWAALDAVWARDANGNVAIGKVLPIDTRGSVVYCPQHLVALIGVDNLIVVESNGALLVCARDRAQDVRQITEELKRRGWSGYV
jgi:mannose-1-phosphate guanylyltransferase